MTNVPDPVAERPEDDDYDLLTYGEVKARLAELLHSEQARLAELQADPGADPAAIVALTDRIDLLRQSDGRYAEQAAAADKFMQAFGLDPRPRTARGTGSAPDTTT